MKTKFTSMSLLLVFLLISAILKAQISGTVFHDFNANGIKENTATYNEPFAEEITVKAYNGLNVQLGTTKTTDVNGAYSFTILEIPATTPVRIEFSLSAGYAPSVYDLTNNGSNVQFATAPSTTVNFALNNPSYYYAAAANISGIQTINGLRSGITRPGIFIFDYAKSGAGTFVDDVANAPTEISQIQDVGSLWGMAYDNKRKYLFSSAVLRRHADLGPQGLGGIYVRNISTVSSAAPDKAFTINGLSTTNGGVIDVGTVDRSTAGTDYLLSATGSPNIDLDAFAKVGKVGIGDIEIDETGNKLWAVNLNQRAFITVDVSGAIAGFGNAGTVDQFLFSSLPGYPTTTEGSVRPWGLKFYRGKGYLGVVATGENSVSTDENTVNANQIAYVLEFDPTNITSGFTAKITLPLNYSREGVGGGGSGLWRKWKDVFTTNMGNSNFRFAQAILAGIEFDEKGDITLGLMDRWGLQTGAINYRPVSGTTSTEEGLMEGDIVKACATSAGALTWVIEGFAGGCTDNDAGPNSITDGPNNVGEFYWGDYNGTLLPLSINHNEVGGGALAVRYGTGEIANTSLNPTPATQRNGVRWYNIVTGDGNRGYTIIKGDENRPSSMGKTLAMGDIEILSDPQPIQIGNRIWRDVNNDGIQNAGEVIAGVPNNTIVTLRSPGLDGIYGTTDDQTWITTTDANGNYYFSDLTGGDNRKPVEWTGIDNTILPGYAYRIEVTLPTGYRVTPNDVGLNTQDNIDNDAIQSGTLAIVNINTNDVNHNYDIGLNDRSNLGNRVWRDDNSNGIQDAGEPGVAGIQVMLYQNNLVFRTTTTDAYGNYLFPNLFFTFDPFELYSIKVSLPPNYQFTTQTNSQITGTSDATNITTAINGSTPDNGSDIDPLTGTSGGFWLASGEIELGVDAGIKFVTPTASCTIGDMVWYDSNGDGTYNSATETGLAGVTVVLYAANGTDVIAITKTDGSGKYLFTNLPPNTDYKVSFSPKPGTIITGTGNTTTAVNSTTNCDVSEVIGTTGYGQTTTVVNTGAAGTNITGIDCGLKDDAKASLGDRVWNDKNSNGLQDRGFIDELGYPGAVMQLYTAGADGVPGGGNDVLVQTTTTDALGNYLFSNLNPAKYFVVATVHDAIVGGTQYYSFSPIVADEFKGSDFTAHASYPGNNVVVSTVYNLAATQNYMGVDLGVIFYNPGSGQEYFGDKVWLDSNGNGIQDNDELGVPNIAVTMLDAAGNAYINPYTNKPYVVVTDSLGNYEYFGISFSPTYVKFSNLPNGSSFTHQLDPLANSIGDNSDVNPATGLIYGPFNNGKFYYDAGILPYTNSGKASLGDKVWFDANNDGLQNNNETGVPNVTVELYFDADYNKLIDGAEITPLATTTTDAQGNYIFAGLEPGSYKVNFVTTSFPIGYTLQLGNNDIGTNDAIDSDPNPLTGLTGFYSLSVGEDNLTVDAGIYNLTGTNSIGDKVWLDVNGNGIQDGGAEVGIPNVVVSLRQQGALGTFSTTLTDANGNYSFGNLANGNYSIQVIPLDGYAVTLQNAPSSTSANNSDINYTDGFIPYWISLTVGTNITDLDAGLVTTKAALGNYVWYDANSDGVQDATETGIAGVTVSLYFDADNDGSISGTEATIPVGSAITDASGKYYFPNLSPGNYQLGFTTQTLGLEFTQQNSSGDNQNNTNSDVNPTTGLTMLVNLAAAETDLTIDAGIRPKQLGGVGDFVWYDANSNGLQDTGEPGVPGIIATVKDAGGNNIGKAITDGNGQYLFTNLPVGTGYTITFNNLPAGASFTNQTTGTTNGSDPDQVTGVTNSFTITAGQINSDIDAGIRNFAPLPVRLLIFTAQLQGNQVSLQWNIAEQGSINTYEVEFSADGINYIRIASVTANNLSNTSYNATHTSPVVGINFYRIKIVDTDGKISYSEIRKVNFDKSGTIVVYPNPAVDVVNITLNQTMLNKPLAITIVSMNGKVVSQQKIATASQTQLLNVSKLASGKYIIRIITDTEVVNKSIEVVR